MCKNSFLSLFTPNNVFQFIARLSSRNDLNVALYDFRLIVVVAKRVSIDLLNMPCRQVSKLTD